MRGVYRITRNGENRERKMGDGSLPKNVFVIRAASG
jgi:hypothetical protein